MESFYIQKIFLLPGKYLLGKKTLYPIILWKIYILIDLFRQKKSDDKIFILNKLSNQKYCRLNYFTFKGSFKKKSLYKLSFFLNNKINLIDFEPKI